MFIPIRPYRFFTISLQIKRWLFYKWLDALYKHWYKSQCHEHLICWWELSILKYVTWCNPKFSTRGIRKGSLWHLKQCHHFISNTLLKSQNFGSSKGVLRPFFEWYECGPLPAKGAVLAPPFSQCCVYLKSCSMSQPSVSF